MMVRDGRGVPVSTLATALALVLWSQAGTRAAQSPPGPSMTLTRVASIPGPMDMVRASGTRAYIVNSKILTIYDISNPASPRREGSYEFPEKIWGFRIVGSLLYLANGFAGLQVLDVSNPAKPTLHGSVKDRGQSKNVSVSGERAVVANHMTGVDLIDIASPANPVFIGSGFLDGYARDASIIGNVAYGVDAPSGLYVFDVAKITTKTFDPISSSQDAHTPQQIEVSDPIGGTRYAVLAGGEPYDPTRPRTPGSRPRGTLQLWSLRNPTAPTVAGLYRTPGIPRHVALQGTTAYVADSEAGVHVVDLSTPAKPVGGTTFKTDRPARSIAITGSTVLVVVGTTAEAAGGGEAQTETLVLSTNP
ncbi:MAG: hypothetical protein FJW27_19320 [Acidimicrobiia bacterium]|nr:hypothetical protein [Acidimicrobiia bacterium]